MDCAPGAESVSIPVRVKSPPGVPEETNGQALGRQRPELWADARVVLTGILALAAGLRFAFLAQNSAWQDEAFVVWIAQHPWREIPGLLRVADQHPPLYYWIMHVWMGVAGTSEAAIRAPSACFSLCSVLLTYLLVRRVSSEPVGLLSALLVAVSPFQIMAAQEARMYPLLGALALGSTVALVSGVDKGGVARWAVYAVASALLVLTQYFGVFVLLAHGVWVTFCERRHLGKWMACMAVATALYAPWVPSLLEQIGAGHGSEWYHNRARLMNLNDLLGLSAFGGSLFGMASYFFTGTLGPTEQFIVVLPFLALLWCGVMGFASDKRAATLLGLPPVVTIGVLSLFSLMRPMFIPRWFSFLVPFLAAFLARGVYGVVDRVDLRRERVVPVLVGVLLLYQVPVLDRYYFDPGFRPFQWRAAARLVRALERPGDGLVFVGSSAAISFKYYFRDPVPSLELALDGRSGPTDAQVRQLFAQHTRLWLVATIPFTAETRDRILGRLGKEYRAVGVRDFSGAIVYLLSPPPSAE